MKILEDASAALADLRAKRPLVLCLTNSVAMEFTANALLALGASPMMLADADETAHATAFADAALVNVGTVDAAQAACHRACVAGMNARGRPWALDPVAYGALPLRTALADELLRASPRLVRANASETAALVGAASRGRGVDAGDEADPAWTRTAAARFRTTVLTTGATDYVFSPDAAPGLAVRNGTPLLTRVTATGCVQGALAAAYCAVVAPRTAALAAALTTALAGEIAAARATAPGSFRTAFLDALDALRPADFARLGRIEEIA